MENTGIDFVAMRKVALQGGKVGVGVVPLDKFTTPENREFETFFDDKRGSGFLIGGVYHSPTAKMDDAGKITSLSIKGSQFQRAAPGDFTAAKLEEEDMNARDRNAKLEKKLKSDPILKVEVDALAAMIRKLPRSQRYQAIATISGVLSERIYSI